MIQPVGTPSGLPRWPSAILVQAPTPTMQCSVYTRPSGVAVIGSVASGGEPSIVVTTIAINAPSCQKTKEAFAEVSSTFQEMSTKHGQIQEGVWALTSMVEALHQAKIGDVKTMAQVQQTLQKVTSVTRELEARVGATEV